MEFRSRGWFWDEMHYISTSTPHVFIVDGENSCIEVDAGTNSVLKPTLGITYDFLFIMAHAVSGSLPGCLLDRLLGPWA